MFHICVFQIQSPYYSGISVIYVLFCCSISFSSIELDQNKERMLEILEDRGLSFMFPLLRIQSELGRQIAAEPTANAVFKWVKDKVDVSLHTDPGFINVLVTA